MNNRDQKSASSPDERSEALVTKAISELDRAIIPSVNISFSAESVTEFGEEIDNFWFFAFRKHLYSDAGVKKWYAPPLGGAEEVNAGFALINLDNRTAMSDGLTLLPKQLLLVAHPRKTLAARVRLVKEGLYCIVAEFSSDATASAFSVAVNVNGQSIWEREFKDKEVCSVYAGHLNLAENSFVDFLINSRPKGDSEPCKAGLRFALFKCDEVTGAVRFRCDDECSSLDTTEALKWVAAIPFAPRVVDHAPVDLRARAEIFDRCWTLNRKYLASLFPKESAEIIADVTNRSLEAPVKYAICMIPRSGSTLLGELLSSTGKLGYPIEYFVPDIIRSLSIAFSDLFSSYENLLKTGFSTENGVFGIEVEGVRFFEEDQFFRNLNQWRVIYLTRNNILAQAISLAISERSGVWHSFDQNDKHGQCLLDNNTIKWQLNFLLENERNFEKLFADRNITPLKVIYEDLVQDPGAQIRNIAEYVGVMDIEIPSIDISNTVLKPTRTGINRYYELMIIMTGGEFWGYNFYTIEGREVAALTGTRVDLLALSRDRAPVVFVGSDRDELRARVEAYIVKRLADF
ncbi:Stf0 family sulfotransferase [Paraburkholderia fungorum]|nr:Stf0 family sulfotransferase [Paraburkholderia fungorum]